MQEENQQICSFSDRLNIALHNKRLRKKDLAEKLGVKATTISRYCQGHHLPNSSELLRISRMLGVSMDWLMGNAESEINKDVDFWKDRYMLAEQELSTLRAALKLLVNNVSK